MPASCIGKWANFTDEEALETETGEPVPGFPIRYEWHTGPWKDIFDLQIELIENDIRRARVDDKLVVYLSCPISARGGGYSGANVDIAKFTERTLLQKWGERFWVLNPAQYQLESKAGAGLMEQHAKRLGIDLDDLRRRSNPAGRPRAPGGGDYMRMWTRVLVENDEAYGFELRDLSLINTGQHFDAFYFQGPRDTHAFFVQDGVSLTSGIESYFARRFATDSDFRDAYSVDGIKFGIPPVPGTPQAALRELWERKRTEFFRYYGLKASGNFSWAATMNGGSSES
jgi:hypothetical protein